MLQNSRDCRGNLVSTSIAEKMPEIGKPFQNLYGSGPASPAALLAKPITNIGLRPKLWRLQVAGNGIWIASVQSSCAFLRYRRLRQNPIVLTLGFNK
jgi:hypothetical protein